MDNNTLTALVLAALDDSAIKELNQRINDLAEVGFKPEIVTELPETGNDHTLYLVLESEPGEDPWYQEYLWLDNEWEKIGTTSIDFEDYYTKDEVDAELDDIRDHLDTVDQDISNLGDDLTNLADNLTANYYTTDETYNKDEIDNNLSNYLAKNNTTSYTPSGNYNPATKLYVDTAVGELDGRFFEGVSEDWDELTDEQKEAYLLASVEDYVELDIADTYNINEALGDLDPQTNIVSDLYEEEAIDITNQIIGGNA